MCRKIISKLHPAGIRFWLVNHPRQVILAMLLCMALSAVLSFTVLRYPDRTGAELKPPDLNPGISPVNAAKQLLETAQLQVMMETILSKDSLSHSDSILVKNAVRRLRELQHPSP